jgi:hypothetical protein
MPTRPTAAHRAADRHVVPLSLVVARAVGEARDALDLGALTSALARRDLGEALRASETAVQGLSAGLRGRPEAKAALPRTVGTAEVLQDTLAASAMTTELCVLDRGWEAPVHVDAAISAERQERFRRTLDKMPLGVRDRLADAGVKVRYVSTAPPLGEAYMGTLEVATRTVWVREGAGVNKATRVLRHELGHALDAWGVDGGWLSANTLYGAAFRADVGRLSTTQARHFGYFAADESEAFAEAFSVVAGQGRSAYDVAFMRAFPNVTTYVEETMRVRGWL